MSPPTTPGDAREGERRGRRPFDYGALRLIVLGMIAERPRHGYELMKAIEERTGGGYSPSPGVIYPTLSWLEDMGYALAEAEGGRRRYRITPEGEAFLTANRVGLAELGAMTGPRTQGRDAPRPDPGETPEPELAAPVRAAMEDLKRALRTRFGRGGAAPEATEAVAEAIRAATRQVEASLASETYALRCMASVATPGAWGHLVQLCEHFARRVPASHEGVAGRILFSSGLCRLTAGRDRLILTIEAADAAALERLQDVVARHLVSFAAPEELTIDWRPA